MFSQKIYLALTIFFLTFFLFSCFSDLPKKTILYDNDFENNSTRSFKVYYNSVALDSSKIFSYNESKLFGRFNNNLITLQLDSLPDHNAVRIQFDLFIHDKWEGSHLYPATGLPDVWQLQLDNVPIMIRTFSNTSFPQSYPKDYNPVLPQNPAHSDAWSLLPGVCALYGQKDGTSFYKIDYTTAHTSVKLKLDWNDALQPFGQSCNKSWSMDNILITAVKY